MAEGGEHGLQVAGYCAVFCEYPGHGGVDGGAQGRGCGGGDLVAVEHLGGGMRGDQDVHPQVAPVEALRGKRRLIADVVVERTRGSARSGAIQAYRL